MHVLKFRKLIILRSLSSTLSLFFLYLKCCWQLLAIGSERDEASGEVDQTTDLQVGAGVAGGRWANGVPSTHHVAVTPLDTVPKKAAKWTEHAEKTQRAAEMKNLNIIFCHMEYILSFFVPSFSFCFTQKCSSKFFPKYGQTKDKSTCLVYSIPGSFYSLLEICKDNLTVLKIC